MMMASKTTRNVILGAAAGAMLVGGVVAAAVFMRSEPPPPPVDAPTTDIMRFAASDRWNKLPADQLQKYYDRFDQMSWPDRMAMFQQLQTLTEDERRRAMENFFGTRMLNQARQYVRLSPEEQQKELDRLIDQQQSMMANMPRMPFPTTRPGGGEGRGWGGGGWSNPAAQKERLERLPPGDRAAMSKFIGDLAQRRAERGLGGWGPGGGGGGWGGGNARPGSGGSSGGSGSASGTR